MELKIKAQEFKYWHLNRNLEKMQRKIANNLPKNMKIMVIAGAAAKAHGDGEVDVDSISYKDMHDAVWYE